MLSVAGYLEAVVGELGVGLEEITGRGRRPEIVRVRELVAVLGVERYGVSVKGSAEEMGRSRVTVSTWVGRGAAKRAVDSSFEKKIDDLDRLIVKRRS